MEKVIFVLSMDTEQITTITIEDFKKNKLGYVKVNEDWTYCKDQQAEHWTTVASIGSRWQIDNKMYFLMTTDNKHEDIWKFYSFPDKGLYSTTRCWVGQKCSSCDCDSDCEKKSCQ